MKNTLRIKKAVPIFSLLCLLLMLSSCGAVSSAGSGSGSNSGTVSASADMGSRAAGSGSNSGTVSESATGSRSTGSAFNKTALNRRLPAFVYDGKDPVEKMLYDAEVKQHPIDKDGYFVIVSSKIIYTSQEQNFLKIFAISDGQGYKIYSDNTVYKDSGWNFPIAVTCQKQPDGKYAMKKYEMPKDGGGYSDSVRAFCKTPVAGTEIKGLSERMMQKFSLSGNLDSNLRTYLKKNKLKNVKIMKS